VVADAVHTADATALQAQSDLTTAYDDAAAKASTATVVADLAGQTLLPGVYKSLSSMSLTGPAPLTLNADGNPDAVFVFQVGSTLTTGTGTSVVLGGSASACNVFWQVGASATLGTSSVFVGSLLAHTSITATSGAAVTGRLLARGGAVTLDTNTIHHPTCAATCA
jgi:hypothetical protein